MIRFVAWMFSLGSLGAIMGLGLMGAVLWAYGRDLPDHESLARYQPATISRVYDGEGRILAEYFTERRIFAPIDEIPDLVKNAFISAEDRGFYDHAGFDALGIVSAVVDYAQGGRLRGASTITQQVMKNFLLTNERSFERKIREIILATRIEQVLSKDQILELYLNEIYLGARAYGVAAAALNYFGKPLEELTAAEAAYLAALPKAPSSLHPVKNREEALERRRYVLGQMLRNGHLDRAAHDAAVDAPLATVLDGSLEPVVAQVPPRDYFSEEIRRRLPTRLTGINATLPEDEAPLEREGRDLLLEGGLAIRATIEPEMQAAAGVALRRRLEAWDRERGGWRGPLARLEAEALADEAAWRDALARTEAPRDIPGWRPAVVLEVGDRSARIGIEGVEEDADGHFIPMRDVRWAREARRGGGRGPEPRRPSDVWEVGDVVLVTAIYEGEGDDRTFDRWSLRQPPRLQGAFMAMDPVTGRVLALQGGFSYGASVFNRATQALRQPGSSFKPFVYAAALDNGFTPSSVILDAPVVIDTGGRELWRPMNASDRFYGPTPMRTGVEQSRNVMTVRLAQTLGMDKVADYAERFGVYENMPQHLSYSLGAGETTLFQMVAAYAMFANGGLRVEPTLVDRVQDRRGRTIYRHDPRLCIGCDEPFPEGALSDETPWPAPVARRIMDPVTAFQLVSMMKGVVERGTATRLQALGFPLAGKTGTTNDARDAWFIGFTPNLVAGCWIGYDEPEPMGRGAFGGTLCAPVFQEFMETAMRDRPKQDFAAPEGAVMVKIDRGSGRRLSDDASGRYVSVEAFRPGEAPAVGEYAGGEVIGATFGVTFGLGAALACVAGA
ncbi:MAG: PBP1A family penicillin-binding protein, partial [Pseudomonadota bacterium]